MPSPSNFPKDTLLRVIKTIEALSDCKTRRELKLTIELHVLSLFDCNAAIYGWLDTDMAMNTMDAIGLTKKDLATINKFVPYDPASVKLFKNRGRLMAYDVDLPRKRFLEKVECFFKKFPKEKRKDHPYFKNFQTNLMMRDPLGSSFGIGLQRLQPYTREFTSKDVVLLELLGPHIFSAAKTLLLSQEYFDFRALAEMASNRDRPIALLNKDGEIIYCNQTFTNYFSVGTGQNLPEPLEMDFVSEMERLNKSKKFRSPLEDRDIDLPEGAFRFQLNLVHDEQLNRENRYYMELEPLLEPGSELEKAMKEKKLNKKATKVCELVRAGNDNKQIVDELKDAIDTDLIMEITTVEHYIKVLHKKFGTDGNRSKLVADLNKLSHKREPSS